MEYSRSKLKIIHTLENYFLTYLKEKKSKKRFFPVPSRDVYLVSYPRSGNTWLRAMIAHLLTTKPARSLQDLDYIIPDIYYRVPVKKLYELPFYVVKSHEPFRFGSRSEKYKKIIYIVRDPRDVVLSYYRYLVNNSSKNLCLKAFVDDYVSGRIFPGSWQEHVNSWLNGKAYYQILLFRYEDFIKYPYESLTKVAQYLDVFLEKAEALKIIESCSKKEMQKKEKAGNRPSLMSNNSYFIGDCQSNNWQDYLDKESVKIIEKYAGPTMRRFDY